MWTFGPEAGCFVARRRVVITGLGIVAPNGIGKDEYWRSLVRGRSAVDRVFSFDASRLPCPIAAEVRDFSPADFIAPDRAKTMGRFAQLAVAASRLAIDDASLTITPHTSAHIGVAYGTSLAGIGDVPAESVVEYAPHLAAAHIATELETGGPAMTVSTSCCSGLDAIGAATAVIRAGRVTAMLAGGSDAPIFPGTFAAFCAFGALTRHTDDPQRASRPYDRTHDGIVLGEAGATLVLEDLDAAVARGARIYAEVLGHGAARGAGGPRRHTTGRVMARAVEAAVRQAGISPDEIDHINAHGCGLPQSDICDTNAFKRALGGRAYAVPITSIKSMIGDPLAAAGVLQTAAACLAIRDQCVPPTINQHERDPQCDLDYVANRSRIAPVNCALVNAQGAGDTHAALVIGRHD